MHYTCLGRRWSEFPFRQGCCSGSVVQIVLSLNLSSTILLCQIKIFLTSFGSLPSSSPLFPSVIEQARLSYNCPGDDKREKHSRLERCFPGGSRAVPACGPSHMVLALFLALTDRHYTVTVTQVLKRHSFGL